MTIGRWMRGFAAASVLALTSTTLLAEAAGRPADDPLVQAAASEAGRIGALMYQYDQAAWHATDRMLPGLTPEITPLMRGYIVVPGENGALHTIFYGEVAGQLVEMARYAIRDGQVISGGWVQERPALSLASLRLINARNIALEHARTEQFGLCASESPNMVVLPPDEQDVISVYILTPPVEAGVYPLGGHHRVRVGFDGEVLDARSFLRTCMTLRHGAAAMTEEGAEPEMQLVTHGLDDAPTEIHAFASRYFPLPLMVVTVENRAMWGVVNGTIEYLDQLSEDGVDAGATT